MINHTVQELGEQLERLMRFKMPINSAFDLLSKKAGSVEEQVVVEVMRESATELQRSRKRNAVYTESKPLSA